MSRVSDSTVTRSGAAETPKERVRARLRLVFPPELGNGPTEHTITLHDLPEWMSRRGGSLSRGNATPARPLASVAPAGKLPLPSRDELEAVLRQHRGNVRATAKHFGRDRRQVYRWLEAHGRAELRVQLENERERSGAAESEDR